MRVDVAVTIDTPVEVVWGITQNAARRTEWDFRIYESSQLTPGPVTKGTQCAFAGSMGMRFSMVFEYVTIEQMKRCAVRFFDVKGLPYEGGGGGWTFTDLGNNRCEFRTRGQFQIKQIPFAGLIDRLIYEPFIHWMTKISLRRLKRLAEAEWSRTTAERLA